MSLKEWVCVNVLPAYVFAYHVRALPTEIRGKNQVFMIWSSGQLFAAMLILGIEPGEEQPVSHLSQFSQKSLFIFVASGN